MRISLNLATRPYADIGPAIKRLRVGMGILAGLCVLLGIGLHLLDRQASAARAREQSVDLQIAQVEGERRSAEQFMGRPANAELLDQTEVLNQLIDQKAFSWTLAMEALETVLPAGVQVTGIEPVRDKDGHITVHLHVIGPHDKAVDLVRNLERSRRFLEPRIVGETSETGTGTGPNSRPEPVSATNRFQFDLQAEYNPPAPGERFTPAPAQSATAQEDHPHAPPAATQPGTPGPNPQRFQENPAVMPQRVGRSPYPGSSGGSSEPIHQPEGPQ
jgi:type IV pilus assembly protein PilN